MAAHDRADDLGGASAALLHHGRRSGARSSSRPGGALGGVRTAIAWYTAVALVGIAVDRMGGISAAQLTGQRTTTHDLDSAEDRHGFSALPRCCCRV